MWISWLLKILSSPLHYVFPTLLLTVRESWVKTLFLLYCVMLIYDWVLSWALGLLTVVFEEFRNSRHL